MIRDIKEYNFKDLAKNISSTDWLVLPGENKRTRKLIKVELVNDYHNPDRFIGAHLFVRYQRKKNNEWPDKSKDLRTLDAGADYSFKLDREQTHELIHSLLASYKFGKLNLNKGVFVPGADKDQIVVPEEKELAKILDKFIKNSNTQKIKNVFSENLDLIPDDLLLLKVYKKRKKALDNFIENLSASKSEYYWNKFLKKNSWVFGSSFIEIIDDGRIDETASSDIYLKTPGNFLDIVELKKPDSGFWRLKKDGNYDKYRDNYLLPHRELQGSISQLENYIFKAEKRVKDTDYIERSGVVPLKPQGLIVCGRSNNWGKEEWSAFRILNDELHNIRIITFDILLNQAKNLLENFKNNKT